jgi:DNA transformation protein and related proteins
MARKAPRKSGVTSRRGELTPLTTSRAFAAFIVDQLSELDDVAARPMFGGVGLYCGSVFFGVIALDVLYFKTDEWTRPAYARLGMKPFMPYPDGGRGQSRYYAVPLDVLESPTTLAEWARAAVEAATRSGSQPTGTRARRTLKRR